MRLKASLFILFMLTATVSSAQDGFMEGYVITTKNDTLYGEVKDRTPEPFGKLYRKIRLKQDGKLFTKKCSPSDVISYKKGNDLFESIWLEKESEFFKTKYISKMGVGERVFMMLMVKGKLSYYHWEWRDPDSGIYMYQEMFKKEDSDEMVRAVQGVFGLKKNIVAEYLSDQPDLANRIKSGEKLSPFDIVEIYNSSAQ